MPQPTTTDLMQQITSLGGQMGGFAKAPGFFGSATAAPPMDEVMREMARKKAQQSMLQSRAGAQQQPSIGGFLAAMQPYGAGGR